MERGPEANPRHTPDPGRVRFASAGLFLIGGSLGLLGALPPLWARHLPTFEALDVGRCFLATAAGVLVARLALSRRPRQTPRMLRRLCGASWIVAAAAATAATFLYQAAWLPYPLFLLGCALGAAAEPVAAVLREAPTDSRSPALLNLFAAAEGGGAAAAVGSAWLLSHWFTPDGLLRVAAIVPAAFGAAAWRGRGFEFQAPLRGPAAGDDAERPHLGALLRLGLLLRACNFGVLGGWLAFYLHRKLGATAEAALAVLFAFWVALTLGRAAVVRLPFERGRSRTLIGISAATLLGCLFVLQTLDLSGAVVGAVLAGAGIGATHPFALDVAGSNWRGNGGQFARRPLDGLWAAALVAAPAAYWSIDAVPSAAAALNLAVFTVMSAIVIEAKLSPSPAAAR